MGQLNMSANEGRLLTLRVVPELDRDVGDIFDQISYIKLVTGIPDDAITMEWCGREFL